MNNMKKVTIIGSGIAGMSAACYLAKNGYDVNVIDKNDNCGGRLSRIEKDGFIFDKGPSWYWMPDIFESFFNDFGKTTSDYYSLKRLDPSYKFFTRNQVYDIPANFDDMCKLFEKIEKGSSKKLKNFIEKAEFKYNMSIKDFLKMEGQSFSEFLKPSIIKNLNKLNIFMSLRKHISKFFKNEDLKHLLEFPSMFLGGSPANTPGVYSLMNFADIKGGTWYPSGGMYEISNALKKMMKQLKVKVNLNTNIVKFHIVNGKIDHAICSNNYKYKADLFLCNAEYPFVQSNLIDKKYQSYSSEYWKKKTTSPSALIFYIGLSKKIDFLEHHNLFFDEDFDKHLNDIYNEKTTPDKPLFYICCPSKSDIDVVPNNNSENLFVLIPLSTYSEPSEIDIENYFNYVIKKIEKIEKKDIRNQIKVKMTYTRKNFIDDYNSYNGNAYGLANTLFQTAYFKPKIKDKKINNLYYCGHFTVPGPGLPPSLLSGKISSDLIMADS